MRWTKEAGEETLWIAHCHAQTEIDRAASELRRFRKSKVGGS